MTIKVIIFDFDGTVANSLDAIVTIVNRTAVEFGYKEITPEEITHFKNLCPKQVIKMSGLSLFQLPFLVKRVRKELTAQIDILNPVSGITEILLKLKNDGYRLGFITSNSKVNVLRFLENHGIKSVFDFIYSGVNIFGKTKTINNFLKQQNLSPEEVIYVGDETRDIDSAKKSNLKVIAVSWGFNSPQILAKHNPDFLIHEPRELLEVMDNLREGLTTKPQ